MAKKTTKTKSSAKQTTEQLVDRLNKLISSNAAQFKPGYVFTEKGFCKLMGIKKPRSFKDYAEAHCFHLFKVRKQSELNTLLATHGIYIKSENYYSKFHVLEQPETAKQIDSMRSRSMALSKAATTLETGLIKLKGRWGRGLSKVDKTSVANRLRRVTQ